MALRWIFAAAVALIVLSSSVTVLAAAPVSKSKQKTAKRAPSPVATPVVPAAPVRVVKSWILSAGLVSFQEPINLTAPSGDVFSLSASHLLFSAGAEYQRLLPNAARLHLLGQGLIGSAQAASGTGAAQPPVTYLAQGVRVVGAELRPSLMWRLETIRVTFGAGIPLIYRKADFPVPAPGYSVDSQTKIHYGILVEGRFESGRWGLVSDIGYLRSGRSVIWELAAKYRL